MNGVKSANKSDGAWYTKEAARVWNNLDESERQKYINRCEDLRGETLTPTTTTAAKPRGKKKKRRDGVKRVSGYQLFYSEQCRLLKEKGISINRSPAKNVAEAWGKLTDDQKSVYQDRAREINGPKAVEPKKRQKREEEEDEEEEQEEQEEEEEGEEKSTRGDNESEEEEKEDVPVELKEYNDILSRALPNELLTTRQHAAIKRLLVNRSHEPEIVILMNLLKECVDDKHKWNQNDGSEYVDNMIKIL
jgi:flagellar biosynthesis GTPase FlhF